MKLRFISASKAALLCTALFTASAMAAPPAPTPNKPDSGGTYSPSTNYFSWSASGANNSRIVISSEQNTSNSNFYDLNGSSYCTDSANCFTTTTGAATYYNGNVPLGGPLWWKVRVNTASGASNFSTPRQVNINPCTMSGVPKYSKQKIGNTYVFQINLCSGADLRAFTEPKTKTGNYCNMPDVPTFPARTVQSFINNNSVLNSANLVISGSFHNDGGIPSFPQLIDGVMRTVGGDSCSAFPKRNLIINHTQRRAIISDFVSINDIKARENQSDKYTIITGHTPSVDKNAGGYVGRNIACVTNSYNSGYGTVIFAISSSARRDDIVNLLKNTYKCEDTRIIQFDGSTVAQVSEKIYNWSHLITTTRAMPQVFYVK